jgi:hypothetical protein
MDGIKISYAEKIPHEELANYMKLTSERCFYVSAVIFNILLVKTIYANFQGSNIKENNMIIQRALERYSQRARNRSTSNNCEFLHVAKVGELKLTQKILEMSKVKLEGIKESDYNFKFSIKNNDSIH